MGGAVTGQSSGLPPTPSLRPPQLPRPIQTPRAPSLPSLPEASLARPSHSGSLYMPRPLLGPVSWKGGGCLEEGTRGQAGRSEWENSFMSPLPQVIYRPEIPDCANIWPHEQGDLQWPLVPRLSWWWKWAGWRGRVHNLMSLLRTRAFLGGGRDPGQTHK